jgi:hypothetical protein
MEGMVVMSFPGTRSRNLLHDVSERRPHDNSNIFFIFIVSLFYVWGTLHSSVLLNGAHFFWGGYIRAKCLEAEVEACGVGALDRIVEAVASELYIPQLEVGDEEGVIGPNVDAQRLGTHLTQ